MSVAPSRLMATADRRRRAAQRHRPCASKRTLDLSAVEHPENVDLAILNTSEAWTCRPEKFLSKARNTPFGGWHVTGRPLATIIGSTLVFSRIH